MKKNNLGFMLVEALIMSVVVIGVLIFMYIQFQNISTGYDKSFHYNTISGLYIANEIKEYFIVNNKLETLKTTVDSADKKFTIVDYNTTDDWDTLLNQANIKTVVLADEGLTELRGKRTADFSEKFNDFINYIKVDEDENNYRILIEFKDDTYASLKLGVE